MSTTASPRTRRHGTPSPLRARIGRQVAERLDNNPAAKKAKVSGAQIYYIPGYLSDRDCDMLMTKMDEGSRRSTLLSDSSDPDFRTSDSCDLDRWSPDIHAIDERLSMLLGIPAENGETIQGQRYSPGQQFRAHHDFFHESQSYWEAMKAQGGQRTWTAMIYLNDVEEGGSTWFPQAGIRVKPERGLLLIWNNMALDGSPNENTLHEGVSVTKGTKYIVTKWFREGAWIR
ncbi:2OG-Fe(II) oxygenase [Stakelama sp. CBK3Z-3]|uniref:2OG-Fe(II) oxygenase n=1 Tax=Stakelama flava TaxID=2860338 RepID=A0ABS6XMY4_9SPHN|nr:2OG-Fe(II) oxygenase [Stakelama flava]